MHGATVCPTEQWSFFKHSQKPYNCSGGHIYLKKNQFKGVKKKETIQSGKHHSASLCVPQSGDRDAVSDTGLSPVSVCFSIFLRRHKERETEREKTFSSHFSRISK